jgi:nicotinamidase-related amidase
MLGNNVSKLARAVEPCQGVLAAAREAGILVIHTREGHRPDMSDVHPHVRESERMRERARLSRASRASSRRGCRIFGPIVSFFLL